MACVAMGLLLVNRGSYRSRYIAGSSIGGRVEEECTRRDVQFEQDARRLMALALHKNGGIAMRYQLAKWPGRSARCQDERR